MNNDGTFDLAPHSGISGGMHSVGETDGRLVQGTPNGEQGYPSPKAQNGGGDAPEWLNPAYQAAPPYGEDDRGRVMRPAARKGVKRPFSGYDEDSADDFDLHAFLNEQGFLADAQITLCSSLASYLRAQKKAIKQRGDE